MPVLSLPNSSEMHFLRPRFFDDLQADGAVGEAWPRERHGVDGAVGGGVAAKPGHLWS